ncbi:MAG: S-adenosylmethionine:tRNA ribosyltransferase-isomerase, partial [Oscillospiraceae bacterium]
HAEHFAISQEAAELITQVKQNGGRVIAVGTTSCRTLETVATQGEMKKSEGYTDIFIFPGYEFKVVDALITNFHLPESTLIMLVSALAGYDATMRCYKE